MSQEVDAVVIVVSEETGSVSVAINGPLLILYLAWLVRVLWREGWSDTKSNDEE